MEDDPDLFDSKYIFDEGSSLQEGLLIRHQGEQKKNKVVPGSQALRDSLRLYFENKKYSYCAEVRRRRSTSPNGSLYLHIYNSCREH